MKEHTEWHDVVLFGKSAEVAAKILTKGDNVYVGTGANSFLCMRDVPADATAVGSPARIVRRAAGPTHERLPRTERSPSSIPITLANQARRAD